MACITNLQKSCQKPLRLASMSRLVEFSSRNFSAAARKCPFASMRAEKIQTMELVSAKDINSTPGDVAWHLDVVSQFPNASENTENPSSMEVADVDFHALKQMCSYMSDFLAKPHPALGRKGNVCPYVPSAMKADSIYLGVSKRSDADSISDTMSSEVERFKTLAPKTGKQALLKCIVVMFPHASPDVIDEVQARLKPIFVKQGLMIGEFHSKNVATGLRNENFYPLRTQVPSLAIRFMVPTDIAFLTPEKYPESTRADFLTSYVNRFEDNAKAVASAKSWLNTVGSDLSLEWLNSDRD